jgi:D-sedoheptulose 7-phosphate isomerase
LTSDVTLTAADARTVFGRRTEPIAALSADADRLAAACRAMAGRFHRGGRLLALGTGAAAADAAHVVVEFVHPVIVGKRALPALALPDGGSAATVALFGRSEDIALAFAPGAVDARLAAALAEAAARGLLTVLLTGGVGQPPRGLDHVLPVPSADARIVREGHVTTYHVLWELVHVFLDSPEVLE